jgi:carbon storage regulator CsrA
MLQLSRYPGETIVIGSGPNEVRVTITEVSGRRVRLAVEAPPETVVMRAELLERPPEKEEETS